MGGEQRGGPNMSESSSLPLPLPLPPLPFAAFVLVGKVIVRCVCVCVCVDACECVCSCVCVRDCKCVRLNRIQSFAFGLFKSLFLNYYCCCFCSSSFCLVAVAIVGASSHCTQGKPQSVHMFIFVMDFIFFFFLC